VKPQLQAIEVRCLQCEADVLAFEQQRAAAIIMTAAKYRKACQVYLNTPDLSTALAGKNQMPAAAFAT